MTRKGMTPAEAMVGRRLPKEAPRLDQLLASYVRTDGSFCGRMAPDESWMRPAMLKARRGGLVRHGGLTIRMEGERGRGTGIWFLTAKGEIEAVEARKRVVAANEARRIWSDEWLRAFQTTRRERDDAEDRV